MPRKLTHEEFLNKFYEKNTHAQDIEILGSYINSSTKIKCKCKIDGYEWETRPNGLLSNNYGCPKCGGTGKLTHEEFMEKFNKKNKHAQDIEILGTYINNSTKIKCRCRIDGYIWQVTPNALLSHNYGCPKCGGTKKLTHEEFITRLQQINPDIEVLGTYVNSSTKILCKCKIDGYEWEATPSSLLQGYGCAKCGGKLRKTHEQFIEELSRVNPNIHVLGTYVNVHTKILCRCIIDGHEWEAIPGVLLYKKEGCPKCGDRRCAEKQRDTQEQFMEKFNKQNTHAKDIKVIGTYVNNNTKIRCKCKIDGYEWEAKPNNLLKGNTGCPKCAGTMKLTHKKFMEKFNKQNKNANDIEIIGTYINGKTKIKCRCKFDGHEWEATPNDLLTKNCGCPRCNISKGEKRIAQYLDNLGIHYIYDKKYFNDLVGTGGGLMRPDFIIPSLKIWIEYDGIQHYEATDFTSTMSEHQIQEKFKKVQKNDQIKNQYAKDNNWTLIRIPFTEYDNIEQILAAYIEQEKQVI